MAQTLEDCVSRLEQMAEKGQQTWDLSANDQEAIGLAVRVLNVLRYLDENLCWIQSAPVPGKGNLLLVGDRKIEAETHLELFAKAGEILSE